MMPIFHGPPTSIRVIKYTAIISPISVPLLVMHVFCIAFYLHAYHKYVCFPGMQRWRGWTVPWLTLFSAQIRCSSVD